MIWKSWVATTAKRMNCQRQNCSPLNVCFSDVSVPVTVFCWKKL